MPEKCPYCGGEFANSKALGSHIHYIHENESWASLSQKRSKNEKEQFNKLLDSCLTDKGLPKPRQIDNLEQVITEIPEGVSDTIDQYREALRCAIRKEKIVKEFEEEFLKEERSEETK
jgi:hypothetical protein